ncbi:MAG: hypothetical protein OJF50_005500 [Nitrospira sp.]|nr:hypothetical protein [Nitrospira sp.]
MHRFAVHSPATGCDMPMALYNHSVSAKPHLLEKRSRQTISLFVSMVSAS